MKGAAKMKDIKIEKLKFKNRVKEQRELRGLTGAELARIMGRSPSYIWALEKNRCFPRGDTRAKLLTIFNCSFNELFYEVITCM